jgi:hypothetical protein
MRENLTKARAASMQKLKDNMDQLQQLEQEIFTVDCKLGKLLSENERFIKV